MSLISRSIAFALLAQSVAIGMAIAAPQPIDVAIIGTDVDISESHIADFMSSKTVEGFPGAKGGWNFETKSPQLMSAEDKAFFTQKSKQIARSVKLKQQFDTSNDKAGFKKALQAEKLTEVYEKALHLGFGTHSTSLVARYSKGGDIRIHMLVAPGDDNAVQKKIDIAKNKALSGIKAGTTVFDTEDSARSYANYLILSSSLGISQVAPEFNKYIKNSDARVVKSELVYSGEAIRADMLDTLKQETKSAPTAAQQKNMDLAFSLAMDQLEAAWCSLPAQNPDVLFVFPAAHSGLEKNVPNAGNSDAIPSFPVGCANKYANVLTNTVVEDNGATIDYANYGKKTIEIAGVDKQAGFWPGGAEWVARGTCPIGNAIAGIAASIWSQNPAFTVAQVKSAVLGLGTPLASLDSQTSTGKFISRDTLKTYDRFGDTKKQIVLAAKTP